MLGKGKKCVGGSLRVPQGGRCSCARDSQWWPLPVTATATDKQVSVRHNPSSLRPSLPPGVRDSRSLLLIIPPLPPDPASQGRRARAAAPASAPGGSPRKKATNVTCSGHERNF